MLCARIFAQDVSIKINVIQHTLLSVWYHASILCHCFFVGMPSEKSWKLCLILPTQIYSTNYRCPCPSFLSYFSTRYGRLRSFFVIPINTVWWNKECKKCLRYFKLMLLFKKTNWILFFNNQKYCIET